MKEPDSDDHSPLEQTDSCPLGDDWSMIEHDPGSLDSINFGILGEPGKPYLLDVVHGQELNNQLLANNLLYPGKFDKEGYDILYVYPAGLEDGAQISFIYMMDAILGYFYDLSEYIIDRNFIMDLCVVLVMEQSGPLQRHLSNLVQFVHGYKGHNLKLVVVVNESVKKNDGKKLKQLIASVNADKVFVEIRQCENENLKTLIDIEAIPVDLGGTFEPSCMDLWLNKRLKFEVFWEDCRHSYKKLQFLPETLKNVLKEVISQNKGKSLEVFKEKYKEQTVNYTFSMEQKNFQRHSKALLDDLGPEDTPSDRLIGAAIRTLTRVMNQLTEYYREYQSVLELSLEAHWRWHLFEKETEMLQKVSEELRKDFEELNSSETESLNDAYSTLQTAKITLHELSKRVEDLPEAKLTQSREIIKDLEMCIAKNFRDFGKNNEKIVNTEFVLNIQGDLLTWIKDFEETLYLPTDFDQSADMLRYLLEKEFKIRKKLTYSPTQVMEEYFETCQKIGSDFLLGSMLGVETCLARLIEKIGEVCQQVSSLIKDKASNLILRLDSLLDRVNSLDADANDTDMVVDVASYFEKMKSLLQTLQLSQPIEYPEIPDMTFLLEHKSQENCTNQVEILDELIQTIEKCIESQSINRNTSQPSRSRCSSFRNSLRTKRDSRASLLTSTQRKLAGRRNSGTKNSASSAHYKTTDDYIDDVEHLVVSIERMTFHKTFEGFGLGQVKKCDKSVGKLFHILKEFKDTEKTYIADLEYLHHELIAKAANDEDFSLDTQIMDILRKADDVLATMIALNNKFDLQVRSHSDGGSLKFARVFTSLNHEFDKVYTEFLKLQPRLEKILARDYFKDIQTCSSNLNMPAESYVNKPMQRICKYKLLLEDALTNTESVFEVPTVNRAVLQSKKILSKINGSLHLQEEVFAEEERSKFYLYAKVTIQDNSKRKAYLFKDRLYLSKENKDCISFDIGSVLLMETCKARLEITLNVSGCDFGSHQGAAGSSLKRQNSSLSLKKIRGGLLQNLTMVFNEYTEFTEWNFKFKNVLGKYY